MTQDSRQRRGGNGRGDYGGKLALARAVLAWERIWPALWPLAGIVGLFFACALLGLFQFLPAWLHSLLLAIFAAGLLAALWLAARSIGSAVQLTAQRRLEIESDLKHRPLAGLDDELATARGDPAVQALWDAHRRRLAGEAEKLRIGLPRLGWPQVDSFGLRAVVGLLLVVGLTVGGYEWRGRLGDALTPNFSVEAANALPPQLTLWVNPPDYTGTPPIYLETQAKGGEGPQTAPPPIALPSGSTLLGQVEGLSGGAPELVIDTAATPFEPGGSGIFKISQEIEAGRRLGVRQGDALLAAWDIEVIPDNPPSIVFAAPPAGGQRRALRIEYQAEDDYGIVDVRAIVTRDGAPEEQPLVLDLGLGARQGTRLENGSYHDLTDHLWAGLPVTLVLEARDAAGQSGRSDAVSIVLPERTFQHPIARMLVELRKDLTRNPSQRLPVVQDLGAIGANPAHYAFDWVVSLAIRSAERRLIYDRAATAVPQVQKLLWQTALRIEFGEMSLAELELRDIQERLMEALENGAPDEVIEQLMSELQQAIDRFLDAMTEQAMQNMMQDGMESQQLPPDAELMNRDDLQSMVDQARDLARTGSRDAAQEMLSQLQEMLENMQAGVPQGMSPEQQRAQETMRQMEEMMRDQQELLDRSFERSKQGELEPLDGEMNPNLRDSEKQEALRKRLGDIMRELGEMGGDIPRPLGSAERSMSEARDALEENLPGEAVDPQANAMDQLQQGLEGMLDQFVQQQLGEGEGGGSGQRSFSEDGFADPLGRDPSGGQGSETTEGRGVNIPEQSEVLRSREILNELRKRSGDRSRPQYELDYIERLMRQF
ncbi:MAG: TIGR02302 family protein [Rhodovibrionaceae bacterium]